MTPTLAVIVLTFNEEKNLPDCLASVAPLHAPIFVVDSFSTDRTLELARAAGADVAQHEFTHYGAQRNWAQGNVPGDPEWVLHLDADERLTPELAREIAATVSANDSAVDGYVLRKRTVFMGRWIKHGGHYPSFHLRLFRRAKGQCEERLYDQHFLVGGPTRTLEHDYIDVLTSDLTTWTQRHARWAEAEAREILGMTDGGRRVRADREGNAIERRRWQRERVYLRAPLFLRAFLYWGYRYFLRLGFLDGREGLIFHFLQGAWYRFLIDAKIHEMRRNAGRKP